MSVVEPVIGKYLVTDSERENYSLLTDNHIEAIYEANKRKTRTIKNLQGERDFYYDGKRWWSKLV